MFENANPRKLCASKIWRYTVDPSAKRELLPSPPPKLQVSGLGRNNVDNVSIRGLCTSYYNARSLVPKFDELSLLVESHNPDIVSLVESCLCADISDEEICIQGYNILCNDCNKHDGSVLMYIKNQFMAELLPSHHFGNLDILAWPCSSIVRRPNFRFCIAAFYHPPSSPVFIFDTLTSFLASLNIPQFSHFIYTCWRF